MMYMYPIYILYIPHAKPGVALCPVTLHFCLQSQSRERERGRESVTQLWSLSNSHQATCVCSVLHPCATSPLCPSSHPLQHGHILINVLPLFVHRVLIWRLLTTVCEVTFVKTPCQLPILTMLNGAALSNIFRKPLKTSHLWSVDILINDYIIINYIKLGEQKKGFVVLGFWFSVGDGKQDYFSMNSKIQSNYWLKP